jgi:hypothetical protein
MIVACLESFGIIKRSPACNLYVSFRAAGYRFHLHGVDRYNNYDKAVADSQLLKFAASDLFRVCPGNRAQFLILRFALQSCHEQYQSQAAPP